MFSTQTTNSRSSTIETLSPDVSPIKSKYENGAKQNKLSNVAQMYSDNANTVGAFSFLLDGAKEIPPADDDQLDASVVAELTVENTMLEDAFCAESDFSEDGDTDQSFVMTENEGRAPGKKRKMFKVEDGAVTKEEKLRFAENKLIRAIDGLYLLTDLPNRASPADVNIQIDPLTDDVTGSAKCLICKKWYKIQWSGYAYKVHNYKRHLSLTHVDTTTGAAKKAMKLAQLQSKIKPISNFFQLENSTSTKGTEEEVQGAGNLGSGAEKGD